MQQIRLVTFNLRCCYRGDGINSFIHRGVMIADKIRKERPDVIAFQEATPENIGFLRPSLPEYTFLFQQREKNFEWEGLAIAYRQESVELYGLDFFWLSETPYVQASRYPIQSPCPRICQAAMFLTKDSRHLFRVYNNHLDHESDQARILGIRQVLEYVTEQDRKMKTPFFIVGDFNAEPGSETIAYCNAYRKKKIVDLTENVGGTFHAFGKAEPRKIDYIYADAQTARRKHSVEKWTDSDDGIYLSDHYPVCLTLQM